MIDYDTELSQSEDRISEEAAVNGLFGENEKMGFNSL